MVKRTRESLVPLRLLEQARAELKKYKETSAALQELEVLREEMEAIHSTLDEHQATLEAANRRITDLVAERDALREELQKAESALSEAAAAAAAGEHAN